MKGILYWIKWYFQLDDNKCPVCGSKPFKHGFENYNRRYFCNCCGFGK